MLHKEPEFVYISGFYFFFTSNSSSPRRRWRFYGRSAWTNLIIQGCVLLIFCFLPNRPLRAAVSFIGFTMEEAERGFSVFVKGRSKLSVYTSPLPRDERNIIFCGNCLNFLLSLVLFQNATGFTKRVCVTRAAF